MKKFTPIILLVIAAGIFYVNVMPQWGKLQALRAESKEYDEVLAKSEEVRSIRKELSDKLNGFSPADVESIEKLIPDNIDVVRLVYDIDGVGSKYGIKIKNIKSTEYLAPTSGGASQSAGARQKSYSTMAISFTFSSSYENLVKFVQEIEKSLRLIDIISISIKPSAAAGSTGYEYSLTLHTYALNSGGNASAQQTQ